MIHWTRSKLSYRIEELKFCIFFCHPKFQFEKRFSSDADVRAEERERADENESKRRRQTIGANSFFNVKFKKSSSFFSRNLLISPKPMQNCFSFYETIPIYHSKRNQTFYIPRVIWFRNKRFQFANEV